MGFTHSVVCHQSSDSNALFHPDSSPMYCLTAVMAVFLCTKAKPRLLLFLPLWYENSGRCVVDGWSSRVDIPLICWLWPNGSKAMTGCSSLISISTSVGWTQGRWWSFLHRHASGFQVGFLFAVLAECRLWAEETTLRSESREETARSNRSIAQCKGTPCCLCIPACLPASLRAERNNHWQAWFTSAKVNKHFHSSKRL